MNPPGSMMNPDPTPRRISPPPPSGGWGMNRRNGSGSWGPRDRRDSPDVRTFTTAGITCSARRTHGYDSGSAPTCALSPVPPAPGVAAWAMARPVGAAPAAGGAALPLGATAIRHPATRIARAPRLAPTRHRFALLMTARPPARSRVRPRARTSLSEVRREEMDRPAGRPGIDRQRAVEGSDEPTAELRVHERLGDDPVLTDVEHDRSLAARPQHERARRARGLVDEDLDLPLGAVRDHPLRGIRRPGRPGRRRPDGWRRGRRGHHRPAARRG